MAGKKGQIPGQVQRKSFSHPGKEEPFIRLLEEIEDLRQVSLFQRYSLTSMIFMKCVAMMCGATDWPKIVVMSNGMKEWLSRFVDMSDGVPTARTFKSVFNLIQPEIMEELLQKVSSQVQEKLQDEVISFDGHTERGIADQGKNIGGLHLARMGY